MAGVDATDLQTLAEEFLAACEDALNTVPVFTPGLAGAPVRSFVAPGEPAADCCPQLTVHVLGMTEAATLPGLTAGRGATFGRVTHVGLGMTLFRCVDMETPIPPMTDLEVAAVQLNSDGWALWNHIYNLIRAGQLFSTCSEVFWDGMRSLTPQGGCAGWFLALRVQLDGYEETLST